MDAPREARNPALMAAARQYVRAAIARLAAHDPAPTASAFTYDRWTRSGEAFVRQYGEHITWYGFYALAEELHALPAYAEALTLLDADPTIAPQLDTLVGTALQSQRLQKDQVLDGLAIATTTDGPLGFDEARFAQAYADLENDLYATGFTFTVIVPVAGLRRAPILKFGRIALDTMADDEADALITAGILPGVNMHLALFPSTNYVLRLTYDLPKRVGDHPPGPPPAEMPSANDFLDVLTALRLLQSEPVALPGMMTLSRSRGRGGSWSWGFIAPLPHITHATCDLTDEQGAELIRLWEQVRDPVVRRREFLGTAIRRFGYAGERLRTEDRFIDLMIAAEAMFVGEKGETTGELTLKISSRFAFFTEIAGTTKRQRYDHMKRAYGARSSIVHGGRPKSIRTQADLNEFTARTAAYLRHALRAMID